MADSENPNKPQKLDDIDLASVSGGTIPDKIMAYADLLPSNYRKSVLLALDDPELGERVFITRLEAALKSNGFGHEYYDVLQYKQFGR